MFLDFRTSAAGLLGSLLILSLMAAGCTTSKGDTDGGLCASRFDFQEQVYTDYAHQRFGTGPRLGEGHFRSCDDDEAGRSIEAEAWDAYAVEGIDPQDAVAVKESARHFRLYVREGMPAKQARRLFRASD